MTVAARNFTVACAEHGPMVRDEARKTWECPDGDCKARLPDEEVYRLKRAAPDDSPDPLPIVVT